MLLRICAQVRTAARAISKQRSEGYRNSKNLKVSKERNSLDLESPLETMEMEGSCDGGRAADRGDGGFPPRRRTLGLRALRSREGLGPLVLLPGRRHLRFGSPSPCNRRSKQQCKSFYSFVDIMTATITLFLRSQKIKSFNE